MKYLLQKLTIYILLLLGFQSLFNSCKFDPTITPPEIQDSIKSINVFLDNSASMEGYMKSRTEFTEIVDDMLTDLNKTNNFKNNLKCFTISDELRTHNLDSFQRCLRIDSKHRIGIGKSSKLDSILTVIISTTDTSDISLLITDGIISGSDEEIRSYRTITKGEYNFDKKNDFKNIVKSIVDKNKDLGIIIQFYNSNFSGKYYKLDNSFIDSNFSSRPFYVIILGREKLLQKFYKQKILKDPIAEIIISDCDGNLIPVQTSDTKGVVANFANKTVKEEKNKEGLTMYLLIPDGFLFFNDFIKNKYKVIYNDTDTAIISGKIVKSSELKINNDPKIKNLITTHSHAIQLSAEVGLKSGDKVEIAHYIDPTLINRYNAEDDRIIDISYSKTLNLRYFIQGIIDGKGKENNKLFSEIINIK